MQTIQKVKNYIHDKNLLKDDAKIIVGVSGGADSIALLDILHRLGYHCIAAHCNFHLRGSESDRDYNFTKETCSKMGIKFVSVDFDTYEYMNTHSISLEMAARELRYNWFGEIKTEHNADRIAVAHHQDDSAETILINLIRGTGIKGLTGIPPCNGNIVRPLLCINKEEIVKYLKDNSIDYITDSTNNENIYTRNKIRLDIIPLLKTINPSVIEAIIKTSDNLSQAEQIYRLAIEKSKQQVLSDNIIKIDLLLRENKPKTVLFEILYPYGFNADTVNNIFDSLEGLSGKIFYSKEYQLVKDRNSLILEKQHSRDTSTYIIDEHTIEIDMPVQLKVESVEYNKSVSIEKSSDILYVDKNKVSFPFTIRRWEKGDKFVPFGMEGSKKLSDYFSDQKFSLVEKENTWLLCSTDKILWIIGERADNRFRITEDTTKIIKISLL